MIKNLFVADVLLKSENPHILNISPPLNMDAKWFKNHVAYTYTKYGMSACTLGMSAEFKSQGIAVNSLWPATTIATAAVKYNFPPEIYQCSRKPEIMADAAYSLITSDAKEVTGNFFTDEQVLHKQGMKSFDQYMIDPSKQPIPDFYL